MAVAERRGIFATKPVDRLVEDTHEKETELRRAVGALDLTALGLGAIIGTGIFVIVGEAITTSGRRSSSPSSWPASPARSPRWPPSAATTSRRSSSRGEGFGGTVPPRR